MTPAERLRDFRAYLDTLQPQPAVWFVRAAAQIAERVALLLSNRPR